MVATSPRGFIPYYKRTEAQQKQFGHFVDNHPRWSRGVSGPVPDRCLAADAQSVATGGLLLPRCHQQTGSCVGAIITTYHSAQCSDNIRRKRRTKIYTLFPFATWGYGRRILDPRSGPGDGSMGDAQARAVKEFGLIPVETAGIPKPTVKVYNGRTPWISWPGQLEYQYSWPKIWPVAESTLTPIANEHQIQNVQACRTTEDVVAACMEGRWP